MAAQSEQEVQAYLDQHKIQATVEEAINACVKANATDPCLFMSQHLASKAQPEPITKIWARQLFDSRKLVANHKMPVQERKHRALCEEHPE